MLDIIIVTVIVVLLSSFLIGLVVMKVNRDRSFMSEPTQRADVLIAKAKAWREEAEQPQTLLVVKAKPVISPSGEV